MNTSEKEIKTSRVSMINGKREAFQTWQAWFRAHGKMSGFTKTLKLSSNQNDVENLTGTDDATKKKNTVADCNDSAMASLTLAFETD